MIRSGGVQTVYINGRFLEQPFSGVQRYAYEMVRALDRQLGGEARRSERWCLVTTGREDEGLDLQQIEHRVVRSSFKGHAWEQTALARATRDGLLVGFGGSGPLMRSRQLVVVHDASVFRHGDAFATAYRTWHRLIVRVLAKRARIATVSRFSRQELSELLGLDQLTIPVFGNGSDHINRQPPSLASVDRLKLRGVPYFVIVGNLTRNKNVAVAIEALNRVPEALLVLVGGSNPRVFGAPHVDEAGDRLIFAGRLDDANVAGLLKQASALLFPSLYEGFGIPPLEAMTNGCPVIASDIPAVREVCDDAALYFDPLSPNQLAARMREVLTESRDLRDRRRRRGRARAARFSWDGSARALMEYCRTTFFRSPDQARQLS